MTIVINFLPLISGIALIGYFFANSLLFLEKNGEIQLINKYKIFAIQVSVLWFVSSVILLLYTLNQVIDGLYDVQTIFSFITQTGLGTALAIQSGCALALMILTPTIKKNGGALLLLLVALIGFVAPLFESHSGDAGLHGLAIGSIIFHLSSLSLWIGSLIALAFLDQSSRKLFLARFSALALWLSLIVLLSGVLNAWTRMNFQSAWSSGYAEILLIKTSFVVVLLIFAGFIRQNFAKRKLDRPIFIFEIALLLLISLLGTWLSESEPPSRGDPLSSDDLRSLAITGIRFPENPDTWQLISAYEADGLILGGLILVTALYIAGVLRLSRRGVKWPVGRTISFALGISAIDYATSGGLGLYAYFSFSHHMIAHMVLGMIAPIGIILGAPITLALRALPAGRVDGERGVRGLLVSILDSRFTGIISNPIVALAIFDGSLFALYFTSIFETLMSSHIGHIAMSLHFVFAGALFFHVIIGIDPTPKKYPFIFRIVILFAAMSIHAFFSIALLSSTTVIGEGYYQTLATPWVTDLLADQRIGASFGWAMGEIPILLALVATFIQWMRSDSKEAARYDRNSERAKSQGKKDQLDEYNDYLQNLANRDKRMD
jgi:putative copper resistance protein D